MIAKVAFLLLVLAPGVAVPPGEPKIETFRAYYWPWDGLSPYRAIQAENIQDTFDITSLLLKSKSYWMSEILDFKKRDEWTPRPLEDHTDIRFMIVSGEDHFGVTKDQEVFLNDRVWKMTKTELDDFLTMLWLAIPTPPKPPQPDREDPATPKKP